MFDFSSSWFLQGLLHPLQTPSHLILLLALGLLLGQQAKTLRQLIKYLALFTVSVVIGFVLNQTQNFNWNNELILLVIALSIGLLTLLRPHVSSKKISLFLIPAVLLAGIMLGLDTQPIVIPGMRSVSINSWLFGSASSIISLILLLGLCGFGLRRYFNGMILRIAGSWIATSAIFVLTLLLVKQQVYL